MSDTALFNNFVPIQPTTPTNTATDTQNISPSSINETCDQRDNGESSSSNIDTSTISSLIQDTPKNGNKDSSSLKDDKARRCEPLFKFGPYVPMLRTTNGIAIDPRGIVDYLKDTSLSSLDSRLLREILPDDSIVEAPSLVTPLLLKKKTSWPPRESNRSIDVDENNVDQSLDDPNSSHNSSCSDEIQVIKVVKKTSPTIGHSHHRIGSNYKTPEEYIQSATLAGLKNQPHRGEKDPILTVESYYKSSVGEMLLGIGLSRVREFTLDSDCRKLANKIRRGRDNCDNLIPELETLRSQLGQAMASNAPYKSNKKFECPHCYFSTDHETVFTGHLETPHLNKREYLCNWCDYRTKDSSAIGYHNFNEHKKRCRLERPLSLHLCRFCQFECQSKRKISTHVEKCEKIFLHDSFMSPKENEVTAFPAITSKLITQEDVKMYEQTLKNLRLAAYNPNQLKIPGSQQQDYIRQPALVVPRQNQPSTSTSSIVNMADLSGSFRPRAPSMNLGKSPFGTSISSMRVNQPISSAMNQSKSKSKIILIFSMNPYRSRELTMTHLLENSALLLALLSAQNANSCQNSVGILTHPRSQQSSFVNGRAALENAANIIMAPKNAIGSNHSKRTFEEDALEDETELRSGSNSPTPNPKSSTFVICEICDAYISDLAQLRTHMQSVHKVSIGYKREFGRNFKL